MAESTLSSDFDDIVSEVGNQFLGERKAWASWVATEQAHLRAWIDMGLREFYGNAVHARTGKAHRWSFLDVDTTLTTVAAQWEYDLADDYGGIEGEMTFATANLGQMALRRIPDGKLLEHKQYNTTETDYPQFYAIRAKSDGTATTDGQRFEVLLWPTPTAVYTLTYKKVLNPNVIDATNGYPNGGMVHSGTILASCLAAAERSQNPEETRKEAHYQRLLQASIERDRRDGASDFLGSNLDNSDRPRYVPGDRNVTYNGVQY